MDVIMLQVLQSLTIYKFDVWFSWFVENMT